jgi:hypothetical protein
MGVNLAALVRYGVRGDHGSRRIGHILIPLGGFIFCFYLWWSLRTPAKVAGSAWLLAGIAYGAIRSRGRFATAEPHEGRTP